MARRAVLPPPLTRPSVDFRSLPLERGFQKEEYGFRFFFLMGTFSSPPPMMEDFSPPLYSLPPPASIRTEGSGMRLLSRDTLFLRKKRVSPSFFSEMALMPAPPPSRAIYLSQVVHDFLSPRPENYMSFFFDSYPPSPPERKSL